MRLIKYKDIKVDFIYQSDLNELFWCFEVKGTQSWVRGINTEEWDTFNNDGFLDHNIKLEDQSIKITEIGPKDDYPEIFL